MCSFVNPPLTLWLFPAEPAPVRRGYRPCLPRRHVLRPSGTGRDGAFSKRPCLRLLRTTTLPDASTDSASWLLSRTFHSKSPRHRRALMVEAKGKSFPVSPDRSAYTQFEPHISVRYRMGQWQPPKDFKDWNDCLLGKRSSIKILPLPNMTVTITSPSSALPA